MKMKKQIAGILALLLWVTGTINCFALGASKEVADMIRPYFYKCDSLDGKYIIAEETRYSSSTVDSAYSLYIVFDKDGNVVIPLGEKSWVELGWEGYVRPRTFRDVSDMSENSHWARADIWTLAAYGVINGYPGGYFYPDKSITRAEFLKMIYCITQKKLIAPEDKTSGFADVIEGNWYAPYVAWATNNGLVSGYPDRKFYPDKPITREEVAVIANRAIMSLSLSFPRAQRGDAADFADSAAIDVWAKTAVLELSRYQFLNGDDSGRFIPQKETTRAEAVTVIARMYYAMYEPDDRWLS